MARVLLGVCFALSPMPVKRLIAKHLLQWKIHPTARIGVALILSNDLTMGENSYIGHGTIFRNLKSIVIADHATIGQWNWFSSATLPTEDSSTPTRAGIFRLGRHSAVTSRHYVDCSGGLSIGAFSIMGGIKSTILSHQIDMHNNRQTAIPVQVGNYCFLGSDIRIVAGSTIPDKCVIAMGAVVSGQLASSSMLYGGVPARPIKHVQGAWFDRDEGFTQ